MIKLLEPTGVKRLWILVSGKLSNEFISASFSRSKQKYGMNLRQIGVECVLLRPKLKQLDMKNQPRENHLKLLWVEAILILVSGTLT